MSFNNKLLTVEDANSILSHFNKGFVDYYELDTRLLSTVDTWFAYDFIDVYRTTGSITFNIKNSLWTGGYKIVNSNINNPNISVSDNSITVVGTNLEWVVLILELSPEFKYEELTELEFNPVYTPIIRPFYENIALTMGFFDGDTPVENMEISDYTSEQTLYTDEDGLVSVISQINKHGDYDYTMKCYGNDFEPTYNFPYQRIKAEIPVVCITENIIKNSKNIITFKFLFDDEYDITSDMLFNNNDIKLIVNNNTYEIIDINDNTFSFNIDLRNYDMDTISLSLKMSGNDYLEDNTYEFVENVRYFTTDSISVLNNEINNVDGAKIIDFNGDEFDEIINVNRDVTIRFIESESVIISDNCGFNAGNGAVLGIENLIASGGNGFVKLDDNASCIISNCNFSQIMGIVIHDKGVGGVTVKDSIFLDNYSCISSKGNVDLYNCTFELLDKDYLTTDTVAFVECLADLNVNYSRFDVNVTVDGSLGFGYLFFKIHIDGSVNGVDGKELMFNESFQFRKNVSDVFAECSSFIVESISNKSVVWTVENTNTVYTNQVAVEYV